MWVVDGINAFFAGVLEAPKLYAQLVWKSTNSVLVGLFAWSLGGYLSRGQGHCAMSCVQSGIFALRTTAGRTKNFRVGSP